MVSKQGSHAFNFIHQGRGEVLLEVPSPRKNVLTGLKHKEIQNCLDTTRQVIDTATERTSVVNSKQPIFS